MKRIITSLTLVLAIWSSVYALTPVLAKPVASVDRIYQYVMSKNPGSSFTYEMAKAYYDTGNRWGIRGDIAVCQAAIETGWFRYEGGTAVTPDDHNYCGLGVTTKGQKGCQFSTMQQGIDAHLQHLWSYATTAPLPSGWTKVDPRFGYNSKHSPYFENFGNGVWAMAAGYGTNIMKLYNEMAAFTVEPPSISASPSSLTFNVVKGSANPSRDITVKGKWLGSGIRLASNSSKYTLSTKEMGAAGGTVTVTLNASFGEGSWDSDYVAIESGYGSDKIRITVPIKTTIEPEIKPELALSATSSTLSAIVGEANPSVALNVKGKDLEGNISYSSSDGRVKVTPASGWSATTGGTLKITADASAAASYSATITVKAGALSQQFVVNVKISNKPALGVSTDNFSLSGKRGEAAPNASVTVTASDLQQDLTVTSNNSKITVVKASGWSASTGGKLVISADASASGSYNAVVTVASGSLTKQIAVAVNIARNPGISVSAAEVSLRAIEGGAAPTANVTVSAEDLEQDITVTSDNSNVTVSKSGWNATTGGTLVISANTASAGTYNAIVTVASGSLSRQIAVAVNIGKKPAISVSTDKVSLSGTRGEAAPTANVTVSASDLVQDISVTSSDGKVTVAKASGWSAINGGTLVISADASASGSYSATVTLASGSLTKQIAVNVNIAKKAELSVSTSNVSLKATEGEAAPTANVSVSAVDLDNDITVTSDNSNVTVSKSGWNATTGGTLVISASAATPGTYSATVTVASGSLSRQVAVVVTIEKKPEVVGRGSLVAGATTFWMTADADAGFKTNGYVVREVKITGNNIKGDIRVSSGDGQVRVSPSTLPAEGGTVTLTYEPTRAASNYVTIPVTVSADNADAVTISCKTKWSGSYPAGSLSADITKFYMTADADAGFKKDGYVLREFYVTGTDIIGEISISSSDSQITVSPTTLPREGGVVVMVFNPSKVATSYVTIPVYVSAKNASTVTVNCLTKWSGKYYANGGMTGIDDVEADTAAAEYYTLQGVRVDAENLTPGLYIRRQGNTVTKVVIR